MAIILIGGLKHCGKSTLGRIIADNLGYRFFDMDELILAETSGEWESVRSIYRDAGKEEFLRLEELAACNFAAGHVPERSDSGAILSLGGGTVENIGAMSRLEQLGFKVYIQAPEELLFKRIMAGGRPPFLSEENPGGDWAALYKRRAGMYEKYADLIHDVDKADAKINAQRLLARLNESELEL